MKAKQERQSLKIRYAITSTHH